MSLYSLEIGRFKILSFGESVGDHITMILDVSTLSLIGKYEHKVVWILCRCVNYKNLSLSKYIKILKKLINTHQMEERLDELIKSIDNDEPTSVQKANGGT